MATRRKTWTKSRRDQAILGGLFLLGLTLISFVLVFGKGERDASYWLKAGVLAISWLIFLGAFVWRTLGHAKLGGDTGEHLFRLLLVALGAAFLLTITALAFLRSPQAGLLTLTILTLGTMGIVRDLRRDRRRRKRSPTRRRSKTQPPDEP